MSLTFGWERFNRLIPELPRLFKMHYDEVCPDKERLKLDFKFDTHLDLDSTGILRVFTARSNKMLVGYTFWFVAPSLEFLIQTALASQYFLDPLYRRGRNGLHLLTSAETGLIDMGVGQALIAASESVKSGGVGLLLEREGYKLIEKVYNKFLPARINP